MGLALFSGASPAPAEEPGPSQTTATVHQQVRRQAQQFLEEHHLVGLSIGVIDGTNSFTLNLGEIEFGICKKPTSATIYEIGSISKTFTSIILAKVVLKGRLRLDQPVQDLLPEGQRVPEFARQPIRLIDLATHTSGLPRIPTTMIFGLMIPGVASNPYKDYDAEYLYLYLDSGKIAWEPGEKYEYSNLGAGLLGFALARYHGLSYDELVSQVICRPLGMADTTVHLSEKQNGRLAPGYKSGENGMPEITDNWDFQDTYAGAGGLKSSVRDMMQYMAANLGRTSGPINRACAFTHATRFADGSTTLGLAWHKFTNRPGGELLIHDGGTGGYSSVVVLNAQQQIGVVVLSNKFEGAIGRLGLKLLKIVEDGRQRKLFVSVEK